MVEERELVTLLLSAGALFLAFRNRRNLAYLSAFPLLFASIATLTLGLAGGTLEALFWENELNFLEHVCYGLSSAFLALWAWTTSKRQREGQ